jgi:hypothetical protein
MAQIQGWSAADKVAQHDWPRGVVFTPGRELCTVQVPPPAPCHRPHAFLPTLLETASHPEHQPSREFTQHKRPCGYPVRIAALIAAHG